LREQLVQEKEAAVQMQLDSLRFAGGMPPGTMVGSLATLTSRPDSQGSRPKHPTKWSESEVYTWVSTLVCEDVRQYCNCFQGNNINGQRLVKLTDSALKDGLGIASLGHRMSLLEAIQGLGKAAAFPTLSASCSPAGGRPKPRVSVVANSITVAVQVWARFVDGDTWEIKVVPVVDDCMGFDVATIIGNVKFSFFRGDNAGSTETVFSEDWPHTARIGDVCQQPRITVALTIQYSRRFKKKHSKTSIKLHQSTPQTPVTPIVLIEDIGLRLKQGGTARERK